MQRRRFLASHAGAALAASLPTWTLWSTQALGHAQAAPTPSTRKLVVIMLRGAIDGLSVVVPHRDPAYYEYRSTIALAPPGGGEGSLLPLDSHFGLHPALARLRPLWDQGHLGFVQASGSPDPTRSHFDAQDFMESGTPGRKSTPDGWMNRLLSSLPGPATPTRAINMGATPPRIFAGPAAVASLGVGPRATDAKAIDDPALQATLARLYGQDRTMARTFQDTTEGRGEIQRRMAAAERAPRGAATDLDNGRSRDPSADAGAPTARGFAGDAHRLGQLVAADPFTQLAFTSVGGWDTHVNQGGARGQLANRLSALGEGLEALVQGLGDAFRDTIIVVMSEFGRTVRQNGTGGTDHGRGNVMWLLGGPVAGAQVLGDWPGLESSALVDGRDLAVTTDFRAVLTPILQRHLGLNDAALAAVFPGYSGTALGGRLLRV